MTIRTMKGAIYDISSSMDDIESMLEGTRQALDSLKRFATGASSGESALFGKAAPCFERMLERRSGYFFVTTDEEDIGTILDAYTEWRANQ